MKAVLRKWTPFQAYLGGHGGGAGRECQLWMGRNQWLFCLQVQFSFPTWWWQHSNSNIIPSGGSIWDSALSPSAALGQHVWEGCSAADTCSIHLLLEVVTRSTWTARQTEAALKCLLGFAPFFLSGLTRMGYFHSERKELWRGIRKAAFDIEMTPF